MVPQPMGEKEANRNTDGTPREAGKYPPAPLLAGSPELVLLLFTEARASDWALEEKPFLAALERSARKRFAGADVPAGELREYFATLHLTDLALACACLEGSERAWEHFVREYRGYLRRAAGAILRRPADAPEACELADSLFADLYGVGTSQSRERSLFRYFHGRSSLKTWLRAILAQRHVDAIRAGRRTTPMGTDGEDGEHLGHEPATAVLPPDPHRERYRTLFCRALEAALASLDARDHLRLRLYYAERRTLAEIGRLLQEHESSVSRNLDRIRAQLRKDVEGELQTGRARANGKASGGLSPAEVELAIEYAAEDVPIDLEKILKKRETGGPAAARPKA